MLTIFLNWIPLLRESKISPMFKQNNPLSLFPALNLFIKVRFKKKEFEFSE